VPSNRRLQSPPGRTGSLARGSYSFRKRSLRRSRCDSLNHSALALFAQCTRIPTSARSIGFCVIWVCIRLSSSSNSIVHWCHKCRMPSNRRLQSWPWPVFRLKWTKFRFVFRSKKAQISLLISFHKKKIRTFRIV